MNITTRRRPGGNAAELPVAEFAGCPQCAQNVEIIGHDSDCPGVFREKPEAVDEIGGGICGQILQKDTRFIDPAQDKPAADTFRLTDPFILPLSAGSDAEGSRILIQITCRGRDP